MSAGPLAIRIADASDLDALVETRVALFRELANAATVPDEAAYRATCRAALARVLGDGSALAWLATGEDDVARGATVLLLFPRLPTPSNPGTSEGYLLNVYVAPEWRRRGAAQALVEAALAESRRRGLARVRLHATPDGRRVYERLGFRGRTDEMELSLAAGARAGS